MLPGREATATIFPGLPTRRYIYFVKGVPTTQEMDIWRVRTTGAAVPERITDHNARVGYPAWLDRQTLIYSATAEDGPGSDYLLWMSTAEFDTS